MRELIIRKFKQRWLYERLKTEVKYNISFVYISGNNTNFNILSSSISVVKTTKIIIALFLILSVEYWIAENKQYTFIPSKGGLGIGVGRADSMARVRCDLSAMKEMYYKLTNKKNLVLFRDCARYIENNKFMEYMRKLDKKKKQ